MDPFQFPQLQLDRTDDQASCRKSTAGILGVLFGAFGFHRFYLGYRWIPVLQFLLTFVTGGLAGLWGTCEGLMILSGRFGRDASGQPLSSARLAYVPAGRPRGAVIRYQHSRSSPWLLTVMIFFFPFSNSLVMAAIWALAGWSLPAMFTAVPALIPPPGGENWVAANQAIAPVLEVITTDEDEELPVSQELDALLELARPELQEQEVLPVTVPAETADAITNRRRGRLVASWRRPKMDTPMVQPKIESQRLQRARAAETSDELLQQVQQAATETKLDLQKQIAQRPELPEVKIARQPPQPSVTGGAMVTPGVRQPPVVRPVYNPSPEYPAEALAKGLEGLVKIQITINLKGNVLNARLVQSSNNRSLDQAAIKAVRQWRFMIAGEQAQKQSMELIVPIRFRIDMP